MKKFVIYILFSTIHLALLFFDNIVTLCLQKTKPKYNHKYLEVFFECLGNHKFS